MNNSRFKKLVNLQFTKPTNAYAHTSKLLYNTQLINLLLKTHTVWVDYYLSTKIQLLNQLLHTNCSKLSQPTKHQYFVAAQLEFKKDFKIHTPKTPVDRDLFDVYTVDRLDKPVYLNLKPMVSLFHTFLIFNTSFSTKKSPTHADFRLLFVVTHGGEVKFVNTTKMLTRWVDMYHLLINIFLYRTNVLAFGSPVFKEELVALNWNLSSFKYKFFKYATPYFFSKDSSYGSQESSTFFSLVHDLGYKILFLTNIRDLEKTVHFLRDSGFYMIAPVPYNMSPWVVSFPVPVVVNNLFTQLFFLKFVTFAQQKSYSVRFKLYNSYWF